LRARLESLRSGAALGQTELEGKIAGIAAQAGISLTPEDLAKASERLYKTCPECNGEKYFWETCAKCNGYGEIVIHEPPSIETCPVCNGKKQTKTKPCPKCGAYGWIWDWQV